MTDRNRIVRKIRACLARAESANENEAAVALRQAQALMAKHGISTDDASAIELAEGVVSKAVRMPVWRQFMATAVANAFGIKAVVRVYRDGTGRQGLSELRFVGPRIRIDLAEYAFQVLLRSCEAAAAKHGARLDEIARSHGVQLHPQKRAHMTKFREGYVLSVKRKVRPLIPTETERAAFDAYMANVGKSRGKSIEPHPSLAAGALAGEEVDDLSNPINQAAAAQQLCHQEAA